MGCCVKTNKKIKVYLRTIELACNKGFCVFKAIFNMPSHALEIIYGLVFQKKNDESLDLNVEIRTGCIKL